MQVLIFVLMQLRYCNYFQTILYLDLTTVSQRQKISLVTKVYTLYFAMYKYKSNLKNTVTYFPSTPMTRLGLLIILGFSANCS